MVENIRFRSINNQFQNTLNEDITKIKASKRVIAFADKTRNLYKLDKNYYQKILRKNITKSHKKVGDHHLDKINRDLKSISTDVKIGDKIEIAAKRQAFVTLKDREENFLNNPTCRLINPSKSDLGRVSKQILETINDKVRECSNANQWKNTHAVIKWFPRLENKQSLTFVMFDIVDFYLSISEPLLIRALDFANQFEPITDQDQSIILHARKSMMFSEDKV